MRRFKAFTFGACCLSMAILGNVECRADTVHINSGETVKGIITRYTEYAFEIHTRSERKSILANQVISLSTDKPVVVLLENGEKIIGTLEINNKHGVIHSNRLGSISVGTAEISSFSTTLSEKDIATYDNSARNKLDKKENLTVGEESKTPPLDYLRGSTVLRKPGEFEMALTLSYDSKRYDNPVISTMFGVIANETRHRFMADLALTVGIFERLEAWVDVPYQWSYLERVEGVYKDTANSNNIGDISFGLRFLALGEGEYHPAVTLTLDTTAPTGENPYSPDPYQSAVASGSGHWALRPGIGFVNTVDPLVFFYGANYKYNFPAEHYGKTWDRGGSLGYYGGVGFAVNDKVSLSTKIMGEHKFESKEEGKLRFGTAQDLVSLGFSAYYRTDNNITISPFVNIGVSDDASPFSLGITCAKTF